MKAVPALLGIAGILCAAYSALQRSAPISVVITGDIEGYLEPCGCTSPMSGGLQRQSTLVNQLRRSGEVVYLANGSMVGGTGRQDQMKLEALSQILGKLSVSAIGLSKEDARLGASGIYTTQNGTGGKLISGSITPNGSIPVQATSQQGPFIIGAASSQPEALARPLRAQPISLKEAVGRFLSEAEGSPLAPILLLDGSESEARQLATEHPQIRLIVYRSRNDSPRSAITIGRTMLVSPGIRGKAVLKLTYDGSDFVGYQKIGLGPEINDDRAATKIYDDYLKQVDEAGLLDLTPRTGSAPYAGSKACLDCHKTSYNIWSHSKHAEAFATLEKKHHGRDPDCVVCHVVGLQAVSGFRSRALTPNLAGVGCESCHGPSERHVKNPRLVKLPKVGLSMCTSCHTSDQSPDFNREQFWSMIRHK